MILVLIVSNCVHRYNRMIRFHSTEIYLCDKPIKDVDDTLYTVWVS